MEENTSHTGSDFEQQIIKWHKAHKRGRITAGLLVVTFGILFLLKRLDFNVPDYFFTWPMIIISLGIVALIRNKFKKPHGYVLITIGVLFLLASWYPNMVNKEIILPVAIILIGVSILFKKRNHHKFRHGRFSREEWRKLHDANVYGDPSTDDYLDSVNFFGGIKKNVTSQNFKGADMVTICGGTDINLTNANFEGKIVLDISCFFAGTTIKIPTDWHINSDVTTIFGGIEDKRPIEIVEKADRTKTVVLQGTCFFGGIEINNFAG